MADHVIRIVVEGVDRASGPLRGISGVLGQMASVAGGIGLANAFAGLVGGAQAAGAAMAGMVTEAGDLEAQIDGIGALAGASATDMQRLSDTIMALGVNPNLKVTTLEAADAIEMLVRNGLTLDQVFAGAAEQTVLLANSTGADFGTAADIATDAMSLFNIQAEDMATAVNGITGVVASSKFGIQDYQLALAQGGAAAAVAGVSFEEFNTSMAAIASNFASGSDAGTSLKTMVQRLIPQSREAAAVMQELGLNFFNADGSMRDMAEVAGELNRAFAGLSAEQRISYMTTIFGTDAMRAAAGMAAYTEEEFRALQNRIGQTDALTMASQRMNNLAGDIEIFGGVVDGIKLQIGAAFQEPARAVVQGLTQAVTTAQPILQGWMDSLAAWVTPYVTQITTQLSDPQWQAQVTGQMESFWNTLTTENRFTLKIGDLIDFDFSTEGWNVGITKFKLSDFFEFFSEDGVIQKVYIKDAIDYSFDGAIAKLSLGDFFDFVSADGTVKQIRIGDLIDYTSAGEQEFTLRIGAFEYAQQPEGDFVVTSVTWNGQPIQEAMSQAVGSSLAEASANFGQLLSDLAIDWGVQQAVDDFAAGMADVGSTLSGYFGGFEAALQSLQGWTWPQMPTVTWPAWTWPALPAWEWPRLPSFEWPEMPEFAWPAMPKFAWPSLPSWSWPALPKWNWPSLPSWSWPSIPAPSWLSWLTGGGGEGRAVGGRAGGLTWVGEFGPELVALPQGSYVHTAGQSRRMTAEAQPTINIYPVINTEMDVEEWTRRIADRLRRRG